MYRLSNKLVLISFVLGTGYQTSPYLICLMYSLSKPPIQWVPGALSLGVKRPGREPDHSSPSSAEVKNAWSYTSTPQYVFMAWCLVKHRGNFTFTLTFTVCLINSSLSYLYYVQVVQQSRPYFICLMDRLPN
jgi:hypothetical protein